LLRDGSDHAAVLFFQIGNLLLQTRNLVRQLSVLGLVEKKRRKSEENR
jgi:hypothetical protein